jgi:hypothetical protein
MPLILTEKDRFDAMVQIASGLIARSHLAPNEIAVEVDAYLKEIVNFVTATRKRQANTDLRRRSLPCGYPAENSVRFPGRVMIADTHRKRIPGAF